MNSREPALPGLAVREDAVLVTMDETIVLRAGTEHSGHALVPKQE